MKMFFKKDFWIGFFSVFADPRFSSSVVLTPIAATLVCNANNNSQLLMGCFGLIYVLINLFILWEGICIKRFDCYIKDLRAKLDEISD